VCVCVCVCVRHPVVLIITTGTSQLNRALSVLILIRHIISWQHVSTISRSSSGQPLVQKYVRIEIYKIVCILDRDLVLVRAAG